MSLSGGRHQTAGRPENESTAKLSQPKPFHGCAVSNCDLKANLPLLLYLIYFGAWAGAPFPDLRSAPYRK